MTFPTATGSNQVVLTWTDNANNETAVNVQRAANASFTTGLTSLYVSGTALTTYTDNTVVANTTYYYRIRSVNYAAGSAYVTVAPITTPATVLAITTTTLANGGVNAAYNQTVTAIFGTLPYSWSATGLPSGLTLNPATGVISGTPANISGNVHFTTFPISITVTDGTTATASTTLNLRINQTAPAAPSGLSATATGSNRVVLTWTDNANNETAVNVQRAANASFTTGLTSLYVSGTALTTYTDNTVAANTTYYYRIKSVNYAAGSAYVTVGPVTTLAPVPAITTTTLANGWVNVPYNQTITATSGTPPYTWSATGLPSGLSINPATGVISGTPGNVVPANVSFATFPVSITVTDGTTATANTTLNLRINQTAPAVPTGLAATATGSNQVVLTWTDNANNESAVYVQRATDATFTTGLTSVYVAPLTTYNDNTVVANTTYYYRIKSVNYAAGSAYVTVGPVTTP